MFPLTVLLAIIIAFVKQKSLLSACEYSAKRAKQIRKKIQVQSFPFETAKGIICTDLEQILAEKKETREKFLHFVKTLVKICFGTPIVYTATTFLGALINEKTVFDQEILLDFSVAAWNFFKLSLVILLFSLVLYPPAKKMAETLTGETRLKEALEILTELETFEQINVQPSKNPNTRTPKVKVSPVKRQ